MNLSLLNMQTKEVSMNKTPICYLILLLEGVSQFSWSNYIEVCMEKEVKQVAKVVHPVDLLVDRNNKVKEVVQVEGLVIYLT